MEIWDAYDEKLNKIEGMTLVRGEEVPDGVFHLVCEIIVKHADGTYLLMQRDPGKHLGGMWEATAGGSALQGEDPMTCALRELSEETGYALVPETSLEVLPQAGFSSTGMTDETVQVVLAQVEKAGSAHTEENEMIEVFTLPIEKIPAFLAENTTAIGTRCQLGLMYIYARYSLQ